ncbi:Dehydrogenase RED2 [Paramyrothecium foliicola]|nr:Dehydrogenase RED2 [Paramyrothecium foliicola]
MSSSTIIKLFNQLIFRAEDVAKTVTTRHQGNNGWMLPVLVFASLGLAYTTSKRMSCRALNHNTKVSWDWDQEMILVTGGSGGIGGATVQKLAQRGSKIVVLDVLPLTYKAPSNVYYYKCDLTKYNQVQEVAASIRKDVGDPTIIIANAGICRGKPILEASELDVSLTFGVNTFGLIWTIKSFLPSLVAKNHGHLLIVASQTAYATTAGITDYSASKAAAVSIYEGIHTELKHVHGANAVRVSCVSPSHVQTGMFTGIKSAPGMVTLTSEYLADTIAGILYKGDSRNIIVPASARWSPWLRVLPEWVRVLGQDLACSTFSELKPHDPLEKAN